MLRIRRNSDTFTPKEVSNAHKTTEVLNALTLESRKAVDDMVAKAIKAGGRETRDKQDYGWMYSLSIEDLDGHIWEPFFMDESKMPKKMKSKKQ